MVRYYGRARQRIGSVNTNQPGLKQAGCPGTVGKKGLIIRYLGKRVNCNLKTCGLPMSGLRCRYGVGDAIGRDKTFMDIQHSNNPAIKNYCKQVIRGRNGTYCQWPQPRNRQNAGGVGHIWTSRRNHCEKTCALGWKENYMLNHTPKELVQQVERAAASWCDGGKGITCLTVGKMTGPFDNTGYGYSDELRAYGWTPFGDVNKKKISFFDADAGGERGGILHSLIMTLSDGNPSTAVLVVLGAPTGVPWATTSTLIITFLNEHGESMSVTVAYIPGAHPSEDETAAVFGITDDLKPWPPPSLYYFLQASKGQTLQVSWR